MNFEPYNFLNCRGRLLSLDRPRLMGILNLTPDSFSDGGQYNDPERALQHAGEMLAQGADIIDIGGFSSRPKAEVVSAEQELDRIYAITRRLIERYPEALISVDTYRPEVAREMLALGVHLINDITGGRGYSEDPAADSGLMALMAEQGDAPYIMMHMQGTPQTMQDDPQYLDPVAEVGQFLVQQLRKAQQLGLKDVVLDPGFGFGKSILHNYQLLGGLDQITALGYPVLVGISRKSMMYRLFDTDPHDVLDLASALHLKALEKGGKLLRVHEVREAKRVVDLYQYLQQHEIV